MAHNLTINDGPPQWNSQPMYHLPPWGEPMASLQVACVSSAKLTCEDCPVHTVQCYVLHKAAKLLRIRAKEME